MDLNLLMISILGSQQTLAGLVHIAGVVGLGDTVSFSAGTGFVLWPVLAVP
jgi:hypothetical protein